MRKLTRTDRHANSSRRAYRHFRYFSGDGGGSTGWVDSYSGGNATTNSYSDVIDGKNASFAEYQDQFNGGQASN